MYGHLGTANLAAYTLTCPIQSLIVGALSGLSAAAGVMVGKHLGKKTYDDAYGDARRIMLTGLVGAIGVASLLVLFAGTYTNLYRVDADVQTLGKALLVVFALYAPVKVENMILSGGILRSGGNTRVIMIIDTIGTWGIGIPPACWPHLVCTGALSVCMPCLQRRRFSAWPSRLSSSKAQLDDQPVTGNFSVHTCSQSRVLTPKTTVQLVLFSAWSSPQYQPLPIILSL